jgi:hypothetical protein
MNQGTRKILIAITMLVSLTLLTTTAHAGCGNYPELKGKLTPQAWIPTGANGATLLISDEDSSGIVGFWRVTFTSKGNTAFGIPDGATIDKGFAQWHSDGTEIMNSSRQPSTGSFCLGTWKKIGGGKYRLNHFALSFDDGVHLGYANIREEVILSDDGNSFSGSFIIAIYDGQGNAGPVLKGDITGTRVKVNTTLQEIL